MDTRHLTFLRRNGVDTYNNYFNRDNKKILVPLEFMTNGISQYLQSECKSEDVNESFLHNLRIKYDPFLYEYRDGENAVPRPPENEKKIDEPDTSYYKNVPLEYIREHGVLEFILESEYLYSLESLFYYSKPSEYQIEYLKKLIKEGRLTQKVFRL